MGKKEKKLVRSRFREEVFTRDRHKCRFCGATENLDAHHITDRHDMPDGGYTLDNGITVCPECHLKCEKFHISGGREWELGMHPNDLYSLIGVPTAPDRPGIWRNDAGIELEVRNAEILIDKTLCFHHSDYEDWEREGLGQWPANRWLGVIPAVCLGGAWKFIRETQTNW